MGFALKQRIEEKNILWAIAFSPDTFVEKQPPLIRIDTEPDLPEVQENDIHYHCFATCGGKQVTLYDYQTKRGDNQKVDKRFRKRQSYTSFHTNEDFYAVTFGHRRCRQEDSKEVKSTNVVCVAGACAIILILDVETGKLQDTLEGSISYISDLKTINCGYGDQKYNLLCSATKDQVRIWNLDTLANVCIFAGDPHGHVTDVLSVDWHPTGSRIVSGGGDPPNHKNKHSDIIKDGNTFQICIWNVLDSPRLEEAIQASSDLPDHVDNGSQFNPHLERFAASVHNDVHSNIVDCVAWLGDLVLSKSIFDEIVLWQPIIHPEMGPLSTGSPTESSIVPIKKFNYYTRQDASYYFVRFALTVGDESSLLAVGNPFGRVFLWDLEDFDNESHTQLLRTNTGKPNRGTRQKAIMRGVAFSPDGKTLIGCDSVGSVLFWEKDD
eukprot:CAMPEP_0116115030 /NCGR_PEP_ID=MMETSP0329-20121206/292_1 /TAXON_ID=697910 /ORGANISM="Pseudo-nitzschia arenysensis, Strain B593" /LENGTH=436 /DNA_ID=CAMNT_0003608441 /DNA_START=385 /DNA_END=1695 /DNA_ORIENTATION=+